jgi:hypothetical protein
LSQRTPNRFASLGSASPQRMHRNMACAPEFAA